MRGHKHQATHYSFLDEMMASPTEPLSYEKRSLQLTKMWGALSAILNDASPTLDDWRKLASAVDMMEQFCAIGVCSDPRGLIRDAQEALGEAVSRAQRFNANIRLTGPGTLAVRSVLEDYSEVMPLVSARTAIRCHRLAEKKMKGAK